MCGRVRPLSGCWGFWLRALTSRGTWLVALVFLSGCSIQLPASQVSIPYTQTWTGTKTSEWLNLRGDTYQVNMRMSPPGCATRIRVVGRNEYPVVSLWPQFVPHVLNPPPPASTQWTGFSSELVAGSYRFEGTAPATCQWTVSIARDLSNAPAPVATCRQIASGRVGPFVRITGKRVALPPDSSLAHNTQLVQPDNLPMSHFGIGIDDGTGVCAVLWVSGSGIPPLPPMSQRVTFTAQVIQGDGKPYLGITSHP